MVEWNGIFRLFRLSGILGQPREVHPKFRNEIPEMSVPFAPKPGISGIFGRMESAHGYVYYYHHWLSGLKWKKFSASPLK